MARGAYQDYVDHQVEIFEYEAPTGDAWREMRTLLSEQGFPLGETTPRENTTLSTDVRSDGFYDVHLARRSAARYALTLTRVQDSVEADGGKRRWAQRDLALEWALIQRVEPARASVIQAEAEKRARRSGAIGRGCDRGCACVCNQIDAYVPPTAPSTRPAR
jgi:hypothetical protein